MNWPPLIGWFRGGNVLDLARAMSRKGGAATARVFPASTAAWSAAFPSVPVPIAIIPCDDAASPIQETVADKDLTQNQALLYAQSGDPLGRRSIVFDTVATTEWAGMADAAFGNIPVGGNRFVYFRFAQPVSGAARSILGKGDAAATTRWGARTLAAGNLNLRAGDGTNSLDLNSTGLYTDGTYYDAVMGLDLVANVGRIITPTENTSGALPAGLITTIDGSGLAPTAAFRLGACLGVAAALSLAISYVAIFDDVLTQAHLTTIRTPQ